MIRLSKKATLALEAVLDIAIHARPDPVQSRDITERQNVPRRYLESIMQHLVHAGILKGVRGPRGGYCLARERRRISVGEILRVIGEMEEAQERARGAKEGAQDGVSCAMSSLGEQCIRPLWDEIALGAMERFDAITIAELIDRMKEAPARKSAKAEKIDYHI